MTAIPIDIDLPHGRVAYGWLIPLELVSNLTHWALTTAFFAASGGWHDGKHDHWGQAIAIELWPNLVANLTADLGVDLAAIPTPWSPGAHEVARWITDRINEAAGTPVLDDAQRDAIVADALDAWTAGRRRRMNTGATL